MLNLLKIQKMHSQNIALVTIFMVVKTLARKYLKIVLEMHSLGCIASDDPPELNDLDLVTLGIPLLL